MSFIILFMSLVFIGIGFIVTEKNAKYLLSVYNTMTEQERTQFDLIRFIIFFKRFHLYLGFSFFVFGLLLSYINESIAGIFIGVYPMVAYIYFIWESKKFNVESKNRKTHWLGISVLMISIVAIVVLFVGGFRESKLTYNDTSINIDGMYGESILKSEIEKIEIVPTLPPIKIRTNGFSLGSVHKGYYQTLAGEKVKLIVNGSGNYYLCIRKKSGEVIYFGSEGADFSKLRRAMNF